MKKHGMIRLFVVSTLLSTGALVGNAQLLKGTMKGFTPDDCAVNYSPDGNVMNYQVLDLNIAKDGSFTFDMPLDGVSADIQILIGDNGLFGVHLMKGKTVVVDITKANGESDYQIRFRGAEPALNKVVNQITQSYDGMKYWSPDESETKSNEEYRALLERENAKVKALLPTIKDKQLREYYTRLAEDSYKWCKIRLIMDAAEDYKNNAEYQQALAGIDVNDPIHYQTNLSYTALSGQVKSSEPYQAGLELMKLTDEKVTLPGLRTAMVRLVGQQYFVYANGAGDYQSFIKRYLSFAGKDSAIAQSIIQQFEEKRKAEETTQSGTPAPDITLNTRDGKQVQLSSLLDGKFTYIDVWATWCGPCVKEIPHLEKLVERFKENDKVQFISISVDSNLKAWNAKLDKDKPQWAQYVLTPENNELFSKQWGITGIPRFIMIDAKGNIFSADATRPSQAETTETIENQTK